MCSRKKRYKLATKILQDAYNAYVFLGVDMNDKIMIYKLIEGEYVLMEEVDAADVISMYVNSKHGDGKYRLTLKENEE